MSRLAPLALLLFALAALAEPAAQAQTGTSKTFQYKLEPASAFETGCFAMCDCAIVSHPLRGTFLLEELPPDPLFQNYRVSDVRWIVTDATTYLTVQGSGQYRIGGEFALQHQLVLDLSVDGGPVRRFDSGLLLGGSGFPNIVIDVSLHQNSACVDTVFHVDASDPVTTSVATGPLGQKAPWMSAAPNPFQRETELRLAVREPAVAEVVIFDVRGRAVRHFKTGWLTPGVNVLHWDGRRDQGSTCPAGVYFMSARMGSDRVASRIVKVD